MKRICCALLIGTAWTAALADSGTLTRDTTLRHDPFADAAPVADLQTGAVVDVQERQGGWYRVRAGSQSGWTRMTTVRFSDKKNAGAMSKVAGLIESGRSGATGATATTGVRGLDENDLSRAQPDAAALDAMGQHAVSPSQAAEFAAAIGLQGVAYPLQGGGK